MEMSDEGDGTKGFFFCFFTADEGNVFGVLCLSFVVLFGARGNASCMQLFTCSTLKTKSIGTDGRPL